MVPAGRLQRALLGVLAAAGGRTVPADLLIEELWGSAADREGHGRLQVQVSRLRRGLEDPELLVHDNGGYRLAVDASEIDAHRFDELVGRALHSADHDETVTLAEGALALWRGAPYEGVSAPTCEQEAARLAERRLALLGAMYAARVARGEHDAVLDEIAALAGQHPLREELHALWMVALDRAGRRSDALKVYRDTRKVLVDELGIEPGPRLRDLHKRIIAGEDAQPAPPSVPEPRQLPAAPPLTGREDDLATLDKAMAPRPDRPSVAVVTGTAGVGKTSLALTWAHQQAERYPDGMLYVDLRGFSPGEPMDPTQVLEGFNRALGARSGAANADLDGQSTLFRSLVARRRVLVVLDNARSVEQVRPLLPGTATSAALITSRLTLGGLAVRDGALTVRLRPLEEEAALALLAASVGDQVFTDPEPWRELVDRCARLPLAVRVVAEQVRARPDQAASAYLAALQHQRSRLDVLDTGDDPETDVRAVLSWSVGTLSGPAEQVFRLLGLLPGPGVTADTVAALTDLDLWAAGAALADLSRAHLVEEGARGWFTMHDLLHAYAAEVAERDPAVGETREQVQTALLEHYLRWSWAALGLMESGARMQGLEVPADPRDEPRLVDGAAAGAWIDRHLSAMAACLRSAGPRQAPQVISLARCLGRLISAQGLENWNRELITPALQAARHLGDPVEEARMSRLLAPSVRGTPRAMEYLDRSLQLARESGDVVAEAMTLNSMAVEAEYKGEVSLALEHCTEALRLVTAAGWSETVVLMANVGELLVAVGRPEDAIDQAETAARLAREAGQDSAVAQAQFVLASAYRRLGDLDRATSWAQAARDLAREKALTWIEGEAVLVLGEVALERGDPATAFETFREALDLGRRIHRPPQIVGALSGSGRACLAIGSADAVSMFEEALDLIHRSGYRAPRAEIEAWLAKARTLEETG